MMLPISALENPRKNYIIVCRFDLVIANSKESLSTHWNREHRPDCYYLQ